MRARVVTALVLAGGITSAILFFPTWAVGWIVGVFWMGGVWEWAGLTRLSGPSRAGYLAVFAALMLAMAWWGFDPDRAMSVMTVAVAWWLIALIGLRAYPRQIPSAFVGLVGPLVLLPAWFLLTHLHGNYPQGPGLTLSILLIVWAADVGAYLVGSHWGRIKLAPRISPGKTWEGLLGGMAMAAAMAFAASLFLAAPPAVFVAVGTTAALVSVVGDLTVSMFKRNVGLKDSGRLLPGHGGILDRIDSLAAATPVFALGLVVSGLVS